MTLAQDSLREKWWYRLCTVVYCLLALLAIIPVAATFYKTWPRPDRYLSTYQLKCNDTGELRGNIEGSEVLANDFYYSNTEGRAMSIIVCRGVDPHLDRSTFEAEYKKISSLNLSQLNDLKNYELIIKEGVSRYSHGEFVMWSLVAVVSYYLFVALIRAVFLFIICGASFWREFFRPAKVTIGKLF